MTNFNNHYDLLFFVISENKSIGSKVELIPGQGSTLATTVSYLNLSKQVNPQSFSL